nr:Bacterial transferase hexapeptide (six repeats) [uncultured bacterium]
MIHLRLADFLSALLYRMLGRVFGMFGAYGRGARIVRPRHIFGARNIYLGPDASILGGAYLIARGGTDQPPRLELAEGAAVGHLAHIVCLRRVSIGAHALLADRVFITDNGHSYADAGRPIVQQPLQYLGDAEIGPGSWVGEGASIIAARVGRNCVIAAGAVVTRDIPDYSVAVGAPARVVRRYCPERQAWLRTGSDGNFTE